MKKRRTLLLVLLALLLVVGIPAGLLIRESHREQASRALIAAVQANDTSAALAALKAGADANTRANGKETPPNLRDLIQRVLDKLLHSSGQATSQEPDTILLLYLHVAPMENPALVKALLDAGADPNLPAGKQRISPLMQACSDNYFQTSRLLLAYGGNVHQKDIKGNTPLHYAALYGDPESIRFLLDAEANIDAANNNGETPAHWACVTGDPKAITALLSQHAHINGVDRNGKAPLDWAIANDNVEIVELLRKAGAKTSKELSSHVSSNR